MPNLCTVAQELPLTVIDGHIEVRLPQDSQTAISQWPGLFKSTLERFELVNSYSDEDKVLGKNLFGANECVKLRGSSILGDPYEGPLGSFDVPFAHSALAYIFPATKQAQGTIAGESPFDININGAAFGIDGHSAAKDNALQAVYEMYRKFVLELM